MNIQNLHSQHYTKKLNAYQFSPSLGKLSTSKQIQLRFTLHLYYYVLKYIIITNC